MTSNEHTFIYCIISFKISSRSHAHAEITCSFIFGDKDIFDTAFFFDLFMLGALDVFCTLQTIPSIVHASKILSRIHFSNLDNDAFLGFPSVTSVHIAEGYHLAFFSFSRGLGKAFVCEEKSFRR